MSANGARASSVASNSEASLIGASGYKFAKNGKKATKMKLKKATTMRRQDSNRTESKDGGASSRSSSPIVPDFGEYAVSNSNELETVICKHCKKPVLKSTAKEHITGCLKSKQEKARKKKEAREAAARAKEKAERGDDEEDEEDDIKGSARKTNSQGAGADDGKKGKKRKVEADEDKEPKKKKKKEEPKPKAVKPKGPVDVEKQCGVLLPNGGQCARSLTCKSHSMGAKRAVPGRSLPYDMLLQAYQKKNQARQQKAAIDANAPALFDEDDQDPSLAGPVDSDEERDAMMNAVSHGLGRPQPLVTHTLIPTRRKYQQIRLREFLQTAMGGTRGSMFAVPAEARTPYPISAVEGNFAMPSANPPTTAVGIAQPGMKSSSRKASIDVG